ncbi:MarR family winged helix-turn-helix transcriptional regulator [Streptomyces sp. UNOC14_S4]|uniref:MarR family winged helix-turn-helix transcriptional regulator n=1 Tax=Streptomyces sp. UNOC14_S4 TaxID=2872340 RepID=UPI001E513D7C|nr:MarR family transcriptional regulator [Streptomyces sp. UNOC14_S4]MCC3770862.1 MarR family transcriptional regulator [Streptomyces sp. UNOC14_S4]
MSKGDVDIEAWRALLLAHNTAVRAIESDVQREGRVPLTWYDVLLELKAAGEHGLRMQEVAERVVLSRTRVSRLVDEMVRVGLVRKEADAADKRVVWAVITEDGREALRATAPAYMRGIRRHFSAYLTEEETEVVAEALTKVARGESVDTVASPSRRRV